MPNCITDISINLRYGFSYLQYNWCDWLSLKFESYSLWQLTNWGIYSISIQIGYILDVLSIKIAVF